MMDGLLQTVSELSVGIKIPNNTDAPHPHFVGIKVRKPCDQEKRRAELLAEQKRKRGELFNSSRDLLDPSLLEDEPQLAKKRSWSEVLESQPTSSKSEADEPTIKLQKQLRPRPNGPGPRFKDYRNKLMLSEWLVDVPKDLRESWLLKICPQGKRTIVDTCSSTGQECFQTLAFTRHGFHLMGPFQSKLPKNTTLDCIWCAANSIFYVLDVLQWNGIPFSDCETDFRFSWLQGKFSEMEDISILSPSNPIAFVLLRFYPSSKSSISQLLFNFPLFPNNVPELDGLLFYHPRGHYYAGHTPLVGWLKPYMLPEILGISVAEEYRSLALPKLKYRRKKGLQPKDKAHPSNSQLHEHENMETEKLESQMENDDQTQFPSAHSLETTLVSETDKITSP